MPWRYLLFFDFIYSFSTTLPKNSIKTVKARIRTGHLKNLQKLLLNTFDACEIFSESKWRLLVSLKFSARPNGSFWCLWNFLRDQMATFGVYEIFCEAKWELLVSMKFSAGPNGSFWSLWNFQQDQMETFDSVIESQNCRMNKNDRLDKIYLQP